MAEPDQLVHRAARRPGRQFASPDTGSAASGRGRAIMAKAPASKSTSAAGREPAQPDQHVEQRGPTEFRDPLIRQEMKKAAVWFGMGTALLAIFFLSQPLLLILAGIVFASILDGGTRLLGRVLPIGRGWRLAIVTLAGLGFVVWVFYFAGTTIAEQAERLREVVTLQANRMLGWANELGLVEGGVRVE